jgi:Flp pilus assembly protein TadB
MNWIKEKIEWLKNKWAFVAASLIIAIALFRSRKDLNKAISNNARLQQDATDKVIHVYEDSLQQIAGVTKDVQRQLANVNKQGEAKAGQIESDKNKLVNSLSGLTNDELAEMLKKENES